MPRHNQKGRSKAGGKFVQLHEWMMMTAAWKSLTPQERCVYVELLRLYNGANNGFLGLGVRAAAERARLHKDTASKCFAILVERGFIEATQLGQFNQNSRRSTEWRLTHLPCDRTRQAGSKAFVRWRPSDLERRPKTRVMKSETEGQEGRPRPATVPHLRTINGGLARA